jgi:hypothetical protein
MSEITNDEQTGDKIIGVEISDEALEALAFAGNSGAYTVAFCTNGQYCPA